MGTTKTPDVVADVDSAHGVDKDVGAVENIIDPLLEKKVLRKVDIYLLTLFGALYMMSALGT
jgi:hypothetical protein